MARIFITGCSDGLGLLTAKALIDQGHKVVLHARNDQRAVETLAKVSGAESILAGDLSSMEETKEFAVAEDRRVKASGGYFYQRRSGV